MTSDPVASDPVASGPLPQMPCQLGLASKVSR